VRSWAEISFRLRQEAANLLDLVRPPRLAGPVPSMAPLLPDPDPVCEKLRGTPYAAEVDRLAREVTGGRFPLFGDTLATGPDIRWSRDYKAGKEYPNRWFRRIPYLDFAQVGDHKAIWELNRHQHLVLLAQAWRLNGAAVYKDTIATHLEHWLDRNPYGRGMQWTSALEVAFRLLSWLWSWHLAAAALPEGLRARWAEAIYQHGVFLHQNLSVYFSPNTHLLGEAVALHAVARLFPALPDAGLWRARAGRIVAEEMLHQVRDDGSHFEQSSYYHVYAVDFFLLHALLEETSPGYRDRLGKMAAYLNTLLGPAGRIPLLGDDDGGRLFHPYGDRTAFGRATLAACARFLNHDGWTNRRADRYELAAWWLGPAAIEAPESEARPASGAIYHAGAGLYSVTRGNRQLLIDAAGFGAFGAGHSHASALSVVLRENGTEILIDPGTFTYVADPAERDRFRSTAAHNTVRMNGVDQADPAGPFRWRNKPEWECHGWGDNWIEASSLQRGLRHRRRLEWRDEAIVVADTCDAAGEAAWHTALPVRETAPGVFLLGDRLRLELPGGWTEPAWCSRVHGSKEPSTAIRAKLVDGKLQTRLIFL